MITKAYVQSIIDEHHVRVRIPTYHKIAEVSGSTPDSELPIAAVNVAPGAVYDLEVGDVVFVGFEEDNISAPVILGLLSRLSRHESGTNFKRMLSLFVNDEASLPTNTQIGEVKGYQIQCLKNLDEDLDIRNKFTELDETNKKQDEEINNLQTTDTLIKEDVGTIKGQIVNINSTLSSHTTRIGTAETNITNLDNNKLDKNTPILASGAFGDTLPQSMVEGQVFFLSMSSYEGV